MSKKRDTFIFKKSWADALKKRSTAVQLEVYNAIVSYAVDGVTPEMSEIAEVVFDFIRIEIDENNAKYEETVKKRREAGRRGMESRWSGKNEEAEQEKLPVYGEDDNKYNKSNTEQQSVTNDNKNNKCYQMITNITDNVSDSVGVNILTDIKKETISNEIVKKEAELLPFPLVSEVVVLDSDDGLLDESVVIPPKKARVDYDRIVKMFNTICVSLSSVTILSEKRKEKVRQRFNEMGCDYSVVENVFCKIQASDFLTGDNSRGWRADFDWVFKNGQNWINIMEGRYDKADKAYTPPQKKSELQKNIELMDALGVKQENVIF